MPEYCESMMKKEELGEQYFDDDAVSQSVNNNHLQLGTRTTRGYWILCTRTQEI